MASAVASQDTANYFAFYNALARVKLDIVSFSYKPVSYYATDDVSFTIKNPTSYRGLALQFFEPRFMVNASGTTTPSQAVIIPQQTKSLDPGQVAKITFTFSSAWNQSWTDPQYIFTIDLSFSTFLDPAAAISAIYLCQTNGSPGTCDQLTVGVEALGPSASRGGGA